MTPTATPTTSVQRSWQRVGQGGLEVASLDILREQLFVGDRRDFNNNGGLYSRALGNCSNQPDFVRISAIRASVLDIGFQNNQGALATFGNKIFYTGDGGSTWQQTTSEVGRPRTIAIAGGNVFYTGAESEGIYSSINGGKDWVKQSDQPQAINILQLNASALWIGTDGTGVSILTIGSSVPQERNAGLDNNASKQVYDFAFRSADEIYIATYDGVYTGDGVGAWRPFGLQGKEMLSLALKDDELYAGGRNQGGGVWRRPLNGDWVRVTSPGWDETYIVRDLLYVNSCSGPLAATNDGVWSYR